MTLNIGDTALIGPVLTQVLLSIILMFVLYARRIPAMSKIKPSNKQMQDKKLTTDLPASARFAAENYNHQFEAPVLFYVLCLCAIIADLGGDLSLIFAWTYVALRIVHSVIHVTYNKVIHRFAVFSLSNFALTGLFITILVDYMD